MEEIEGKVDHRELIINFAKDNHDVKALQFIRDDPKGTQIKLNEGTGTTNYVYTVQSADNKSSVILKYAEETLRCLPELKLSLERQELEYICLKLMNDLQPGSVPEPYCLDTKHHILAMADMSDWELLGTQLQRRDVDLEAAVDLGRLLGKLHMETTRENVTGERWQELKTNFEQLQQRDFVREYFDTHQFAEDDTICTIAQENLQAFRKYVDEVKTLELPQKISDLFNMQICLIHADCHFNSIFVKKGKAVLFDFEYSFLSHPAFNVALPVACIVLIHLYDVGHVTGDQLSRGLSTEGFKAACLQAISNMIVAYLQIRKDISNSEESQKKFLSDVALFTGCHLFHMARFTQMGQLVDGLDDSDCRKVRDAGFHTMKNHENVNTVEELINMLSLNTLNAISV